jgi:hypothetical protein
LQRNNKVIALNKSKWEIDMIGALGECAVAKATGLYWSPDVNVFKVPDVGADLHVRTTNLSTGRLIIRERDPDGIYVLAVGELDEFIIHGWIHSDEAKHPKFWRTDAWWIPQNALHPLSEIRSHAPQEVIEQDELPF